MKSEAMTNLVARATVSLQRVNLDSAMSAWVANSLADENPEMQRAMRQLFQIELTRRSGTEITGYAFPAFEEWGAEALLSAGAYIKGIAEASSKTGDPGLMDLAFRMLELWMLGLAVALVETGVN